MAKRRGAAQLVDAAIQSAAAPLLPPEPEQLSLLPEVVPPGPVAAPAGPGRQPGSRNRVTAQTAARLIDLYGNPLQELLRLGMMDVGELARQMQAKPKEAMAEKRLCLQAAIPYLCRKMPVAVEVDTRSQTNLIINLGGGDLGVEQQAGLVIDLLGEEVGDPDDDG